MKKNKKVLLGMSGGVDSSVAALLLKQKGYEVIGTTMKLFECPNYKLNNSEEDAKKICEILEIEHINMDCSREFKEYVIEDFIKQYSECKTPNPCIECNKYLKFGEMYKKAEEQECYYLATGHYAKTEYSEKYKRWVLKKSNAGKKDQSYVLWNIPKQIVEHLIFPLSNFESKEEIRQIANENNLPVAQKPDSEDICFIPDGNYKEFLEKNSDLKPLEGNIVNLEGKVLGKHTGLYNYTIGQRKGLGIAYKEPLFVIGFNKEKNEVIVGEEDKTYKQEMHVKQINLLAIDKLEEKMKVKIKTRYSSKEEDAFIEMVDKDLIKVEFIKPVQRITPGQSAVFYDEDIVIGGGKIC